ncbi:MAG: hypothetical protein N2606_07760 [Candidatus Omnitrophica bacterium]|nr:hypothetical protein [Candidatus Omnitrophota bacterium]
MSIRLSQFFKVVTLLTTVAVLYVWQQTEIIKLAYDNHKNTNRFQELLDENSWLRYNLKKNASVVSLGNKGFAQEDFSMPSSYCVVTVNGKRTEASLYGKRLKNKTLFAGLLNLGKEAQAKTIHSLFTFKSE